MRVACTIVIGLTLTGCATPQAITVAGKSLCDEAWRQINIRPGDKLTDATAIEIEGNNLAREAIGCKYQKPAAPQKATS